MPKRKFVDAESQENKLRAVVYYCEKRLSQQQIAKRLKVDRWTVSRWLSSARDEWFVEGSPTLIAESIEAKRLAQARKVCNLDWTKLEAELEPARERLKAGPAVHVVATGPFASDRPAEDEMIASLAKNAADEIAGLFLQSGARKVGVSWGRTVFHFCQSVTLGKIGRQWRDAARKSPVQFVPISGDLINNPFVRLTASNLCRLLHDSINGPEDGSPERAAARPLELGAAAAYIPAKFEDAKADIIRDFFKSFTNYRKIFVGEGDDGPLINELDSIIMSVGSSSKELEDVWLDDVSTLGGISREKLDQVTLGNIAGFFLARDNLSDADADLVDRINARWTGVRQSHIARCAREAARGGRTGVIVIASGKQKAAAVRACAKLGLANHVVIDTDLAEALIAAIS